MLREHTFRQVRIRSGPLDALFDAHRREAARSPQSPHYGFHLEALANRAADTRLGHVSPEFTSLPSAAGLADLAGQSPPGTGPIVGHGSPGDGAVGRLANPQGPVNFTLPGMYENEGSSWGGLIFYVPGVPPPHFEMAFPSAVGYFTQLQANWTLPNVAAPLFEGPAGIAPSCFTWIGFDGTRLITEGTQFITRKGGAHLQVGLFQGGFASACYRGGTQNVENRKKNDFWAWVETYSTAVQIGSFVVSGGDLVGAAIVPKTVSGHAPAPNRPTETLYAFWNWSRSTYCAFIVEDYQRIWLGETVEWIVEKPSHGNRPLPRFGTVYFADATCTYSELAPTPITPSNGVFNTVLSKHNPFFTNNYATYVATVGGEGKKVQLTATNVSDGVIAVSYSCDDALY
jgi:Peptidase A4 family